SHVRPELVVPGSLMRRRERSKQIFAELMRRRVAVGSILRECPKHDPLEPRGVTVSAAARRLYGFARKHGERSLLQISPLERVTARREQIEQDARREDVRAAIDRFEAELLGRHVSHFALELLTDLRR